MAVSVSNFEELKNAIEDEITTEIIVLSNIVFAGAVKVNVAKSNINIDFGGFNVEDNNSLNISDTIYVDKTSKEIKITLQNAIWNGRNRYGVVGVNTENTNTTLELIDIEYTGPQFVYNKNGTTIIKDCTVTITKNQSSSSSQEFCEANKLNIFGIVKVKSDSSQDSVIWFSGENPELTVFENAIFEIEAKSTYFLYTDAPPTLLFKQNSSTIIFTNGGLFYASGSASHIAKSFTLEENASFVAYKLASNSIPMFKCVSDFSLKENSTFNLFTEVVSSTPLIYFGENANISISSPKNVVLYSRGGDIFSFGSTSTSAQNVINISCEMLRLWNIATYPISRAGGIANTPTNEYFKKDYSINLELSATASASQISSVQSNLENGDTGFSTINSIKLITSNVISMGKITLETNKINDQSTQISGTTDPLATMLIDFNGSAESAQATESGTFELSVESPLTAGDNVKISTNKNFLTKTLSFSVDGTLSIVNIPPIKFLSIPKNPQTEIIQRQDSSFNITVSDTRLNGSDWFLYAYILSPLSSTDNKLDNALIFKNNNEEKTFSQNPILIYSGKWSKNQQTTISWKDVEGILLKLDLMQTYSPGIYKTQIMWQISTSTLN